MKGIMFVESAPVSAEREGEFNDWYDTIHIPEILSIPGFLGARRFELRDSETVPADPSKRRYVAVYELEADDLDAPIREMRARREAGTTTRSDSLQTDPPPVITVYELRD